VGAPWFEALTGACCSTLETGGLMSEVDESGWAWFIPLHDGRTSVGVVVEQKRHTPDSSVSASVKERYFARLALAPGVMRLIGGEGRLVGPPCEHDCQDGQEEGVGEGRVHSASDYSYSSVGGYAGEGWRVVGDAGGASPFMLIYRLC
jgi:flavin-dependent dehydrogenase